MCITKNIVWLLLAVFLVGCSTTESENIRTKGIRAEMSVTATGASVNNDSLVEVRLYSGSGGVGGTLIELSGGDTLRAYADAQEFGLVEVSESFDLYYHATLPTGNLNTVYKVSFIRDEGVSATESTVMLPEPFEVTSDDSVDVTKEENLNIAWSPAIIGEQLAMRIVLDCRTSSNGSVSTNSTSYIDDDGSEIIDISNYIREDVTTCDGEIHLKRIKIGSLDSNFGEGGSIEGVQRRIIEFNVTQS